MIPRKAFAGLLSLAVCASCAHRGHVQEQETAARNPATAHPESGKASPLNNLDTILFGDLFHVDTHGKKIRRTMKTRFWTDMDSGHLREGASDAIRGAVMKSLTDENDPSIGFAKKLQANLIENIMKEFVMTLKVFKIVNKTLQFDMYFLPSLDSPENMAQEFSSNGLIQLEKTGQLAGELSRFDNWKFTSELSTFAKDSRAIAPADSNGHRAIGSVLTINIKILDMNWDLSRPIPKPKQNAVKGFIRVRRYFAAAPGSVSRAQCEKGTTLKGISLSNASKGNANEQWTTVDAIYSFNLASFAPKADRIEIYPGRLMAPNQGSDDLLPNGSTFVGKTLKSGDFELKLENKGAEAFTVSAKKLVFSFAGEMNRDASDIRVSPVMDPSDGGWITPDSHEEAVANCGLEIRQQLNWDRFFSAWTNGKNGENGSRIGDSQ